MVLRFVYDARLALAVLVKVAGGLADLHAERVSVIFELLHSVFSLFRSFFGDFGLAKNLNAGYVRNYKKDAVFS